MHLSDASIERKKKKRKKNLQIATFYLIIQCEFISLSDSCDNFTQHGDQQHFFPLAGNMCVVKQALNMSRFLLILGLTEWLSEGCMSSNQTDCSSSFIIHSFLPYLNATLSFQTLKLCVCPKVKKISALLLCNILCYRQQSAVTNTGTHTCNLSLHPPLLSERDACLL